MQVAKAALLYFVLVFAAGFAMGTVRTMVVAPNIGPVAATALELPIMIAVSWFACGQALKRCPISADRLSRLAMGALALGLLLAGEACISTLLAGLSLSQHFALYLTAPVLLGLLGQLAFAAFPLIRN